MKRVVLKHEMYGFEHEELPAIYGFEDQVPVAIFNGECLIDFREIYEAVSFLYEET